MNINEMAERAYDNSEKHGFWDRNIDTEDYIPEKLCLIHSEVSEALEEYRDNKSGIRFNRLMTDGKLEGFGSELADIIIRAGDLAGALGLDLESIIERKMHYNESRPYKHNKAC